MIASGVSIGISEQALLAIIAGLTFVVGCFVGAQFKENQLSYRLNYLRAELDAIKAKLEQQSRLFELANIARKDGASGECSP